MRVTIKSSDGRQIKVSRKAFDQVYRSKGFTLTGASAKEVEAADADLSGEQVSESPNKATVTRTLKPAVGRRATKARKSTKKSSKQSRGAKAATEKADKTAGAGPAHSEDSTGEAKA